ncbi:c-type cytochrome biogenesis protein CcsB [Kitasatospora aureofaciens]|uniref:C-type cytochrome biogenesis protein CcsB n=1 Tax=Kitasatospora aureofaciens TaxID=1894 RepID=A0A1E7N6D9_KITAU|nr:c-type cytochrome biogenesis protein CcsB [Kitasatospora aureofaciens]QEV01075.1 c-type cytochrome biogenesis protein CcsB [Streptomyces viridifaciens]ARF79826.1 c-type cytochrome biogenesis protein CcsB [Kitasatospora aureofaciens]OEV36214.1 c-type cytochrome biogenesis protein CcsB [Kitasatospora aureofaciens]UKZ07424.1 c-type cytochrome biogenesis protein CcsB [Streptomyces viridifaciens]GGU86619.1 c-type cytochrome biogenesis protein CcsB [Kitasatospora aureofaciens]
MHLASGVDPQLADLSNKLIYSAMAVYTIAMFAHMFEWTFGSKGAVAVRSKEQSGNLAETVAAAETKAAKKVTVTVAGAKGGTTTLTRTVLAGEGATVVTGGRTDEDVDGPGAAGTSEKADLAGRIAISLTVLALLLHGGGIVARGLSVSRWPWGNMYEFSCAFAFAMTAAYVVLLAARKNVRWLGLPVTVAVLLTLGIATQVLYTDSEQLVPALHSYWLAIHVSTAIFCGGAFYAAFISTLLYLVQDSYRQRADEGKYEFLRPGALRSHDGQKYSQTRIALARIRVSVCNRLPAASTFDKLSYRINALVFPLWTFTIIAGAIWAEAAWGKYWEWDPKETWSFITWVAYACYLHARATAGWKGRKAAYLALAAFACWLFNYYGVNIFVTGKHSYAGI